jgi:hypothetical protein
MWVGKLRQTMACAALLAGLLAGGCGTTGAGGEPASSADSPVSDRDGVTVTRGPAAGSGTAVIAVADPSGKPLSDIPVEVRTIGRPMPAALAIDIARLTDARGEYTWGDLPPGEYEFTVRIPGGDQTASRRATVTAGGTVRLDITLG